MIQKVGSRIDFLATLFLLADEKLIQACLQPVPFTYKDPPKMEPNCVITW